jgi:hypothetical protein
LAIVDEWKNFCQYCERFVIVNDYEFELTKSKLLNNSVFAKKWYFVGEEMYDMFDCDFDECIDSGDCEYLATNLEGIEFATEHISHFIESVLNDGEDKK